MSSDPSAALAVIADHLERYHEQMGDMLVAYQHSDRADMVNAIVESERALRNASRAVRKAAKLARSHHGA
jgi:major membrane immunogen (membrane-anchored lipoprotein)